MATSHPLQVTSPSSPSSPRRHVVAAYMDLTRDDCLRLFPSGRLISQTFRLAGRQFFLSAHCNMDQMDTFHCFGLFLAMAKEDEEGGSSSASVPLTVDYDFAARTRRPSGEDGDDEFVSVYMGYYEFRGGKAVGYRNLFGTPWDSFMADGSVFFVDGVLHLRAELHVKEAPFFF
uniref:MATH domain-containing protein n=1 Tax=Leersia perrieri TaxID=77586 RepID=A0A0D9WQQ9_9ORYZ